MLVNVTDPREARRLRTLFGERTSMTHGDFGKAYGLGSASMVWQYLNGRRQLHLLAGSRFAKGLRASLDEVSPRLAKEWGALLAEMGSEAPQPSSEYVQIPLVDIKMVANKKRYSFEPRASTSTFIAFRDDWLRQRKLSAAALFAVECPDEGMQPTICRGDLVVVNRDEIECQEAQVFAINYEGQLRLRRLFRDDGAWWLHCDDTDDRRFPRKKLVDRYCYVLGRVVHRQSERL